MADDAKDIVAPGDGFVSQDAHAKAPDIGDTEGFEDTKDAFTFVDRQDDADGITDD
jgi:hypothetical protein